MSPLEYGDLIDSPAEGMMTTQEPAGAWHLGGGWDVPVPLRQRTCCWPRTHEAGGTGSGVQGQDQCQADQR